MDTREINKIPIPNFLKSIGIYPERKFNGYWIYKSFINPNQKTGSLKISKENLWVDYSSNNMGGTLIDLVLLLYPDKTVSDIVKSFSDGFFSFHQRTILPAIERKENYLGITMIGEFGLNKHPELIHYLKYERGIKNLEMAAKYLKTYQYKRNNHETVYWNLGAKNYCDGYNMFAKNFKTVTKQGFTLIANLNTNSRIYFEAMLDFLSFLMIYPEQEYLHDFCILNSVNNLNMSLSKLQFKAITISFFDKDKAGDVATEVLRNTTIKYNSKFYDYRRTFKGKDLNDFLNGKFLE